ncbi:DUF1273 domain-containing protein [Leuconostocaceae bacterium ESL0958]|nr:DUF1273 domain-containing protein [Leuconostocaceae bacterium ESL0958]
MSRYWITGYRTYELGVFKESDPKVAVLKHALTLLLKERIEQGLEWVITGGQLGVETWTVEVALAMKADYPELKVALLLPFANFGSQWQPEKRRKLAQLSQQVDFFAAVHQGDYQGPFQLKNYQQFLLDHSDAALLLYDPEYEGKSAYDLAAIQAFQKTAPYPMDYVSMDELQEFANDFEERRAEAQDQGF